MSAHRFDNLVCGRALVVKYRERLKLAADKIGKDTGLPDYAAEQPGAEVRSFFQSRLCWYWSPLSITRLPTWLSLALIVLWLLLALFGERVLGDYVRRPTNT